MSPRWPRRFLGLPLHPMLVHVPLVLWLTVPVLDVLAWQRGADPWWSLALWATGIGVVVGLCAAITGLLDFVHLSETGSNDVRLAARHGVRTSVVLVLQAGKFVVAVLADAGTSIIVGSLVVDSLAAALLLQGAFFGTKITYGNYGR